MLEIIPAPACSLSLLALLFLHHNLLSLFHLGSRQVVCQIIYWCLYPASSHQLLVDVAALREIILASGKPSHLWECVAVGDRKVRPCLSFLSLQLDPSLVEECHQGRKPVEEF